MLSWTVYDATSCVGNSTPAVPEWNKVQPISGALSITPAQNSTFTLTCTGTGGTTAVTRSVEVINTTNLAVSCSAYPSSSVGKNELVTRTATAIGGTGAYIYSWSGVENLIGDARSVSTYYSASGSKAASITVTSGGQSVTSQCPVSVSSLFGPKSRYKPTITSITPVSGPLGTKITVNGYGYADGATFVVLKKGTNKVYIRPVINVVTSGNSSLTFDFEHSTPLTAPEVGDIYSITVINSSGGYGDPNIPSVLYESNTVSFTASQSITLPPALLQVSPSSGLVQTPVTLTGTGFIAGSMVIAKQGNYVTTFVPSLISPTSMTFTFIPGSITSGDFTFSVSNKGVISNELGFLLKGPAVSPPPYVATSTPRQTPVASYNANIITRIAGRVLTSAEANGCVANIKKNGVNSAGGCVYTLTNLPPGNSYQVEWLGGYPVGADTTKKPTVSPAYPQTLGERPAGINPATFYIDFQAAPVAQPITVLPWTGPASVQASSTFSYKLNWSGGPIITTDNHGEWTIFVFFSKPGEATSFYNGGLYPLPAISTWSGGVTSIPTSISVPYGTPPGTYEVYTGIFRGPVRQELVLGSGVIPKYAGSKEYKVGTVVVE